MPRCSVPRAAALPLVAALLALPAAAGALAPGLPIQPSMTDYARCAFRSFLVTPKPPVRARAALAPSVEASRAPLGRTATRS